MNLDVNAVVSGLLDQIGDLAKENAMLKVQIVALQPDTTETIKEDPEDGGDSV